MLDYIVEVGHKFLPLTGFATKPADNVRDIIAELLKNENTILVGEENKGFILGIVYPYLFNPEVKIANELIFWVEDDYKSCKFPISLVKQFEAKAKEKGATKLMMLGMEEMNPEGVSRLYNLLGMKPLQFTYHKDV